MSGGDPWVAGTGMGGAMTSQYQQDGVRVGSRDVNLGEASLTALGSRLKPKPGSYIN
jgi:hypothetical protein